MSQPNNPLHGIKLADILTELIENLGWEEMNKETGINCFANHPTFKSSLKFLRQTPWARKKTEDLYLDWLEYKALHNL
ncbi:VF530 family protein [Wenyingzhuangia sp. IMCC45533]